MSVWSSRYPLSGLLSVREWQGSALAFSAFEFLLRLGALLAGAARGSPMLAVALLSAGGVVIAGASIVRFLLAGHSSARRVLGPAVRLVALAVACLLPAALLFHAGSVRVALAAAAVALLAYYSIVARSALAHRVPYFT